MLDFASFETFDPDGAGLGNLFNPISPIEALGIWPSGDFRLDPGAGFAPAFAFYVGGLIAALALLLGLVRALQAGETALASALAAGGVLYVVRARRGHAVPGGEGARDRRPGRDADRGPRAASRKRRSSTRLRDVPTRMLAVPALTLAFLVGAAGSSASPS